MCVITATNTQCLRWNLCQRNVKLWSYHWARVYAGVYAARVYMEEPSDFGGYFGNLPELQEGSGQLFLKPEGYRILTSRQLCNYRLQTQF